MVEEKVRYLWYYFDVFFNYIARTLDAFVTWSFVESIEKDRTFGRYSGPYYQFLIDRNIQENTGKQLYNYTFNIFRTVQIQSCLRYIKTGTKDNIEICKLTNYKKLVILPISLYISLLFPSLCFYIMPENTPLYA